MTCKKLYEFHQDHGRMGSLTGRLLMTEEEYEALIGRSYSCDDILGKHSELYGEFEEKDFRLITDNQEFIQMAETLGVSLESGHDPRYWLDEIEEDEEE